MDDKRNIILAILLTGLILIGWPLVMETFFPNLLPKDTAEEQASAPGQAGAAKELAPAAGAGSAIGTEAAAKPRSRAAVLNESPRIAIATAKLTGSINLTGARIDDLVMPAYRQSREKNSPPVRLLSPTGTDKAYFARFGWVGAGVAVPDANSVWTTTGKQLTPKTPVKLTWRNNGGQTFTIRYSIDANYLISVEQSVTNASGDAIALTPFGLISRVYDPEQFHIDDRDSWTIHNGPIGVFDGAANFDWNYDDVAEAGSKGVRLNVTDGWAGFTDKYWMAALIPAAGSKAEARFRSGEGDLYQAEMAPPQAQVIAAGATLTTQARLFAGAKETILLDRYRDEQKITLFDRAIDWGWFYWFEKPLFYLLHWLFGLFGNFGVAIIAMTFVVRGLMFPLAQKQFASMAQLRAIQPKMKKIQEKYKDDKQKQQQEILNLYKEEKANPLAGCLPIFLQIPIFFALYKVLMLSIEMRHQPFVGWIQDLSAPDPLTPVNLFGLLDFMPPPFLAVGILPILMSVTMWMQFKLNPAPVDPVQQQVFAIMPWMMMFIMAPFAAGLQLYWTVSNILTIAQQKWLYSRHPQLKEAMDKERAEKAREAEKAKA